jgi:hypothetical protein
MQSAAQSGRRLQVIHFRWGEATTLLSTYRPFFPFIETGGKSISLVCPAIEDMVKLMEPKSILGGLFQAA